MTTDPKPPQPTSIGATPTTIPSAEGPNFDLRALVRDVAANRDKVNARRRAIRAAKRSAS